MLPGKEPETQLRARFVAAFAASRGTERGPTLIYREALREGRTLYAG